MNKNGQDDAFAEIDAKQDEVHAKWWEIVTWLAQQRGDHDVLKLTAQQRIGYAAELREQMENWEAANVDANGNASSLIPKTDVQRKLAEYYELSESLGDLIEELEDDED